MGTNGPLPEIIFPDGYFGRWEDEAPYKGYLQDVVVKFADGSRFKLFFVDPVRLSEELEEDTRSGRPYFGEPNMVVLPRVTTDSVREAVQGLILDGYFDHAGVKAEASCCAPVGGRDATSPTSA